MRPDDHDLDEEIRGHLAINIKERIERGEDPEAARLAAMREFGYLPHFRDQMRQVWYSRWYRHGRGARARRQGRHAIAAARQGSRGYRHDHAGARHRRQRGDLQRRPWRVTASAREPRRRSAHLHSAERARAWLYESHFLRSGNQGPPSRAPRPSKTSASSPRSNSP